MKHSRTSSASSYEKDFSELIKLYTKNKNSLRTLTRDNLEDSSKNSNYSPNAVTSGIDDMCRNAQDSDDYEFSDDDGFLDSQKEEELSVQYLEDDYDRVQGVDDLDGIEITFESMNILLFLSIHQILYVTTAIYMLHHIKYLEDALNVRHSQNSLML